MHPAKASPHLEESTILVVDDEEANVRALEQLLRWAGYSDVVSTTDSRRAEPLFEACDPDLILLDLHMPEMDGFAVMEHIVPRLDPEVYLPILILTGDRNGDVEERALSAGAKDFVLKPFEATEVLLRIKNLLETRRLHRRLRAHAQELEQKVRERTQELAEAQVEILRRLALAAEYRDDVTGHHAERVGVLSALLASELGFPPEVVRLIRRAAPLHDVGKIGIPDAILLKPARLSAAEYEVMKSHTEIGARILGGGRFHLLELAQEIARSHHERWDGGGYLGLEREEIPLVGRVVAVADVFDSLTNERPYKLPIPFAEAVAVVESERGRHFDPDVVDAFHRVVASGRIRELDSFRSEPLPERAGD